MRLDCDGGRSGPRRANVRVTYAHEVKSRDLENFESLVRRLKELRTFITPEQFFDFLCGKFVPPRPAALMTFDDGRLSSCRAARSVLDRHGIRAMFFVPTGVLELRTPEEMKEFLVHNVNGGKPPPWPMDADDYEVLTAEAIRELSAAGHMVLPHTHSHADLQRVRDEDSARRAGPAAADHRGPAGQEGAGDVDSGRDGPAEHGAGVPGHSADV